MQAKEAKPVSEPTNKYLIQVNLILKDFIIKTKI